MHPKRRIAIARTAGVASNFAMWISAAVLMSATQGLYASGGEGTIAHEQVTISLPVFVVALGVTIASTWTIARYDLTRNHHIHKLERRLAALEDLKRRRIPRELDETP